MMRMIIFWLLSHCHDIVVDYCTSYTAYCCLITLLLIIILRTWLYCSLIDMFLFIVHCYTSYTAMTKFDALKSALDVLPRPTLIMCKSNRRAGMVWATYTGKLIVN